MTKHLVLFVATFIAGAVIALAVRTALHKPVAEPAGGVVTAAYSPMVNNTAQRSPGLTPAPVSPSPPAAPAINPQVTTVNTVCAICGMDVDPDMPAAIYEGKRIGFGCKSCPAKFAAKPELYGPAALRNEVVKK